MHNSTHNHEASAIAYLINYNIDYFSIKCAKVFIKQMKQNRTFTLDNKQNGTKQLTAWVANSFWLENEKKSTYFNTPVGNPADNNKESNNLTTSARGQGVKLAADIKCTE